MAKRFLWFVTFAAVSVLVASCGALYTGGGWVPSAVDPQSKATFSLNIAVEILNNDPCTDVASGRLEYDDHAAGVRIRADVLGGKICEGSPVSVFTGTYLPQPQKAGPGGTFTLTITQDGLPGFTDGDILSIKLDGGVYLGYANTQLWGKGGGDIKRHER